MINFLRLHLTSMLVIVFIIHPAILVAQTVDERFTTAEIHIP